MPSRTALALAFALGFVALSGCRGVLDEVGAPQVPGDGGGAGPRLDAGLDPTPPPESDASTTGPSDPDAGLPTTDGGTSPVPRDAGLPTIDGGTSPVDRDAGLPTIDGGPADPDPEPESCASPIEAAELELTNRARRDMGLGDLRCDEGLARAARLHSQDMCDLRYFSHDSQDGRSFVDRIEAQGVTWRAVGENIAQGQTTPEAVHDAWMNSSGHRANILSDSFGRIGIGYVECGGRHYWTQDFAD